jgi:hypothetical protein
MPKDFANGKIKLRDEDIYAELGIDKSSKATKKMLLGPEQVCFTFIQQKSSSKFLLSHSLSRLLDVVRHA